MKRLFPLLIILAVLVGGLALAWHFSRSKARPPIKSAPALASESNPNASAKLGANPPHILGSQDAPVMLEEFGDFECPPCGLLHPVLKLMKEEFGLRVVLVFREYPLVSLHPHALGAARAAEAAGLQGKFWQMHNLLFENQTTWHTAQDPNPIFEQYAATIGLDLTRFRQDISSEVVAERLRLDRERANWIGVNSTPTLFLNGREVPPESLSAEKLRALIKAQLVSDTGRD